MTNADSEARIIDVPLLLWSLLAVAELFIIAHLTAIPWVAFFCFVLIGPLRAALGDESEFEEIEEPPKEPADAQGQGCLHAALAREGGSGQPPKTAQTEKIADSKPYFVLFLDGNPTGIHLLTGQKIANDAQGGPDNLPHSAYFAEVTHKPDDPTVLGLTNRGDKEWLVQMTSGECRVAPQKSIGLASEMKIDFGVVKGVIRLSSDTGENIHGKN